MNKEEKNRLSKGKCKKDRVVQEVVNWNSRGVFRGINGEVSLSIEIEIHIKARFEGKKLLTVSS